jgi:hypothetical protein
MFNYLFVGGRFGDNAADCRPSSYIKKLFDAMMALNPLGVLRNGGKFEELTEILKEANCGHYQVVLWGALILSTALSVLKIKVSVVPIW